MSIDYSDPSATQPPGDTQATPYGPGDLPEDPRRNGVAIAAVVVAGTAVAVALIPFLGLVGILLGLVGVGLGIAGIVRSRQVGTGLTLAIIAIVVGVAATPVAVTTTTAGTVASVDERLSAFEQEQAEAVRHITVVGTGTDSLGNLEVEASVANDGAEAASYMFTVNVMVGTDVVGDATFITGDLAPGESATVTAPVLTTDADYLESLPEGAELTLVASDVMRSTS